ncbi:MAG: hypothetical protein AVDCRST_MAG64-2961 [uncultured Phycisphaerae bacterium]|uniref:Uncharacterized protein n=1 Tax=uncultured Phycisphaerae bacterium TaxID=904963 RepID=A0A6J4PXK5_9BACT|nr:MAG: hypothetical protein AVDCRST_MAG64-2961 [uncultured Phycisphaerae bacterium]
MPAFALAAAAGTVLLACFATGIFVLFMPLIYDSAPPAANARSSAVVVQAFQPARRKILKCRLESLDHNNTGPAPAAERRPG